MGIIGLIMLVLAFLLCFLEGADVKYKTWHIGWVGIALAILVWILQIAGASSFTR